MATDLSERYEAVKDAIHACTDEKRLMTLDTSAIDLARQAYALATEPSELPAPWPEIGAYRLAHLLMRSAKSPAELQEVDRLFARAAGIADRPGPRFLGPLPALYRLAVLHRLAKGRDSGILHQAMEEAREAVRQSGEHHREAVVLDDMPVRIQDGHFNMLELACYFLGGDYQGLLGLGSGHEFFPRSSNGWYVLGQGASGGEILLSRDFALEQLESLGRSSPTAVLMKLLPGTEDAVWCAASKGQWCETNHDGVKLLSWLLKEPHLDRGELRQRVFQYGKDPGTVARFRQTIKRAKEGLRELTGKQGLEVFSSTNPLRIAPGLKIFAAVHRATFTTPGA